MKVDTDWDSCRELAEGGEDEEGSESVDDKNKSTMNIVALCWIPNPNLQHLFPPSGINCSTGCLYVCYYLQLQQKSFLGHSSRKILKNLSLALFFSIPSKWSKVETTDIAGISKRGEKIFNLIFDLYLLGM